MSYLDSTLEKIEVRQVRVPYPDVPLIIDDWTLAFLIGFTGQTLWYLVKHRATLYTVSSIPKKTGGRRQIFDPSDLLRRLQVQLRYHVLRPLVAQLGPHVTAYQLNKSTIDAAKAHIRECAVCDATTRPNTQNVSHPCPRQGSKFKLDLKNFFLSTRRSWVRQYFHQVVGYNHYASSLLGQLLTTTYVDVRGRRQDGVPPGSLTAGDICNLVADWKLDTALRTALPEWTYTRYADDLYFSHEKKLSPGAVRAAITKAANTIEASGYRVNWKKVQQQPWEKPQRLLGVNINRKMSIPANEYARMHNLLYHIHKYGFEARLARTKKASTLQLHGWIQGKLNYFKRISPEQTQKLEKLYHKATLAHPLSLHMEPSPAWSPPPQ